MRSRYIYEFSPEFEFPILLLRISSELRGISIHHILTIHSPCSHLLLLLLVHLLLLHLLHHHILLLLRSQSGKVRDHISSSSHWVHAHSPVPLVVGIASKASLSELGLTCWELLLLPYWLGWKCLLLLSWLGDRLSFWSRIWVQVFECIESTMLLLLLLLGLNHLGIRRYEWLVIAEERVLTNWGFRYFNSPTRRGFLLDWFVE